MLAAEARAAALRSPGEQAGRSEPRRRLYLIVDFAGIRGAALSGTLWTACIDDDS